MKRIASLCLVLVSGSIALGQQSTDWRPNVAEDNKAATWEATSTWLVAVLNTSNDSTSNVNGELVSATDLDLKAPDKCSFDMTYTVFGNNPAYVRVEGKLNANLIDPLSVRVKTSPNGGHSIYLESGDRKPFLRGTKTTRNSWADGLKRLNDLPQSCQPDKKGRSQCEVDSAFTDYKFEIFLADEDLAKRAARAFMHSALICGGAKAVSPF
jgi:hypothetical protein